MVIKLKFLVNPKFLSVRNRDPPGVKVEINPSLVAMLMKKMLNMLS
jgi:hypothetical protein